MTTRKLSSQWAREFQAQRGWTDLTLLHLVLNYLDHDAGDRSLKTYLEDVIEEEEALEEYQATQSHKSPGA